jgi:hypothetical protein
MKTISLFPKIPGWMMTSLVIVWASSCNVIQSEDDIKPETCTATVKSSNTFTVTENLLNVNEHFFSGDSITFEYSYYTNQICPSKPVNTGAMVTLSDVQERPVEVSFWYVWGSDPLQRMEKNKINPVDDPVLKVLIYYNEVQFTPNDWVFMNDAAIVTTHIRIKFFSPYHNANSDIVYLESIFKEIKASTMFYHY